MKDNNMNFQSSENILLTGAGFTKNFGGLLASEMWAEIFNHEKIQAHPKIKELMSDDFDYESIYYSIMEGSYTDDEKEAIDDAVKSAYEYIDSILRQLIISHPNPLELYIVNDLISKFSETGSYSYTGTNNVTHYVYPETSIKSFIFTLNQDLFFERLYHNHHDAKVSIPRIKNNSNWFTTYFNKPLNREDYCQLPNEEELSRNTDVLSDGNFFLIKLHGSYNWISFDGIQKMVIGRGKTDQIQKEPLLKYYFEIFENVLSQNERRLLIIGYGFSDKHINRIISKAIRDYGLKIYIMSPISPEEFKKKLCEKPGFGINIWQGISGYFQYILKEIIFSKNMSKNTAIKQHFDDIFWAGLNKI